LPWCLKFSWQHLEFSFCYTSTWPVKQRWQGKSFLYTFLSLSLLYIYFCPSFLPYRFSIPLICLSVAISISLPSSLSSILKQFSHSNFFISLYLLFRALMFPSFPIYFIFVSYSSSPYPRNGRRWFTFTLTMSSDYCL
jgi:hypothetical protein